MTTMKLLRLFKSKNILIYFLSFAASAVGIGLNFFLARALEAEYYGRIQYLVALATTCSQILIFGINMFLIREAKNAEHKGEIINKCFSLYLMIVVFFVPIIYFVLNNYVTTTQNNIFVTTSVLACGVLMGINSLIASYYQGSGKYQISVIFESFLPKLFLLLTAVVFIAIGKATILQENYLIFYIVFYSCVAIPFILILFRRISFSFKPSEIGSIVFFFGVTITYSLGNNLTKVLQGGLYHNNVALAIISISISFINLVHIFTAVLDNLIKPIFAKKKREKDIAGLFDIYRFETRANAYLSIPMYMFLIFNPTIFLSLFGSSYTVYPLILSIIAIANFVNDMTGSNGTMLAMTGNEKWELFNGISYFAVYISSIFIFSFDKIYGLCFALLAAQIVVNIIKYTEVWIIFKKSPLDVKTLLTILIIVVSNCAPIIAFSYIKISIIVWLVLAVILGVILVVANFFVLSLHRKNDFKQLLQIRL